MIAAPRVNAAAWFALAVAVPMALLAIAAAAGRSGAAQAAGFWAAMLLAPAIALALTSLERRRFDPAPTEARDDDLTRAFALTTGQACGLLFVVAAGARFSGESVALGLTMAGVPLALSVARRLWRAAVKPLDQRLAPPVEMAASRNWTAEWLQAEALRATSRPAQVTTLRPPGRVTLRVQPVAPDERWMAEGEAPTSQAA